MLLRRRTLRAALATLLLTLPGYAASAANIGFSSTVVASDLTGPLLLTAPTTFGDVPIFAYNSLDNGNGTGTSIDGFTSLMGVNPADLTILFGDIERLATTYTPGGCVPTPPPGFTNCDSAITNYGDGDASPSFFNVVLAGVGTILIGQTLEFVNTIDSDLNSPGFATASGVGTAVITGGLAPYFDEVLALTGGTGIADIQTANFDPLCIPGTDPCTFNTDGVVSFVPEPSTALLVLTGLAALSIGRRAPGRRQRRS